MVGRELGRSSGSACISGSSLMPQDCVIGSQNTNFGERDIRLDTYLYCIGRKEMKKLGVCERLEKDDFG